MTPQRISLNQNDAFFFFCVKLLSSSHKQLMMLCESVFQSVETPFIEDYNVTHAFVYINMIIFTVKEIICSCCPVFSGFMRFEEHA